MGGGDCMNIKETLRALPRSYDDFVESTAECMEEYDDVRDAVLEQLRHNPDSTPSDVLKIVCEKLGMTKPIESEPQRKVRAAML